jgi:hypothetical protein
LAQIRQVVSESLQATIRRLLPSQQGFTEDLQASNVITPIIDLTPSAEGDTLPSNLAEAVSYGGITAFSANGATTVIANTAGFWRIKGVVSKNGAQANNSSASFSMSDGISTKTLEVYNKIVSAVQNENQCISFEFTVFLAAGESISCTSSNTYSLIAGHVWQIADVNGNRVNPSGFTSE